MLFIMVNGLRGLDEPCACAERLACVKISVESREIAAGDLDSDFVAGKENVSCHPHVYFVTINSAGLNEARSALRVTIPGAQDAVTEIEMAPVRMDIHMLRRPIGIFGRTGGVKYHLVRPGDFQLGLKRFAGENQNIFSFLDLALVSRPGGTTYQVTTTGSGNRVVRVVHEFVNRFGAGFGR